MRRKLKNFWMHPNENLCRSLDLFGQDVYHNRTMLPPRETMLGSNLCKRTLQRCLCTNLPQFRRYSVCPNIQGVFKYIYSFGDDWSGAFRNKTGGAAVCGVDEPSTSSMNLYELKMGFEASASSSIFGTSVTVQTASLRALSLIRAY